MQGAGRAAAANAGQMAAAAQEEREAEAKAELRARRMSEHSEQVQSRMLRGLAAETAKIDFSGIFQTEEDVLASMLQVVSIFLPGHKNKAAPEKGKAVEE